MSLGLPDLAYIIELLSNHIDSLYKIKDNPDSAKDAKDSTDDGLMRVFGIASNLQYEYESQWYEGVNFPPYDELMAMVERNKLL